jgi:hypothetical protein
LRWPKKIELLSKGRGVGVERSALDDENGVKDSSACEFELQKTAIITKELRRQYLQTNS